MLDKVLNVVGKNGHVSTAGQSGQVEFFEDARRYQHHRRGAATRSLGRQLHGDESQPRVWTWDEFFCLFVCLFFERPMQILMCYHNE